MNLDNLFETINNLESFDFQGEFDFQIYSKQTELTDKLRSQLELGLNGDGSRATIDGFAGYHPYTKRLKKPFAGSLSGETRFVTNFMSGQFYSSLAVVEDGNGFEFTSSVSYFTEIVERGDESLLTLNAENTGQVTEEVANNLKQEFEATFNGL